MTRRARDHQAGLAIRIGSAIKEINRRIDDIEVPALVCGSFSDHNLHSQGSINGFRRVASAHKWLYTHRGPKWATYYSPQVLATQHGSSTTSSATRTPALDE